MGFIAYGKRPQQPWTLVQYCRQFQIQKGKILRLQYSSPHIIVQYHCLHRKVLEALDSKRTLFLGPPNSSVSPLLARVYPFKQRIFEDLLKEDVIYPIAKK
jgi:hypothetical protein